MTGLIALAQIDPALGNLAKNIETHLAWIERARDGGADLVVFPELSLTGYTVRDLNFATALRSDAPALRPFLDLSHDIAIVLGGIEEAGDFGIYNAAFVFDGGTVRTYRKVYPPDYGIFEEGRYFLRGRNARPVPTRFGPLGVLVCEDLWHLSLPMLMALEGATTLCVISSSPTRLVSARGLTNHELNHQHHATICRLLSVNMVFVNRVGYEDGVNFWGGSEAVDAFGTAIVEGPGDREDLLFAELSDETVRRARRESRHFLDEDPRLIARELDRILREHPGNQ